MDAVELARALFAALAQQDDERVRSLCLPDLRASQNNARPMTLDTLLAFNRAVRAVVTDLRYEDAVRSATHTGFVEEHAVRGTLPDGRALDLAVCVVADVRDGKVAALREYVDTAAAAPLVAALR